MNMRFLRLRKATLAMTIGWLVGFLATSPFQIIEVLRNSGSNVPLLFSALGYGFAVWMMITLVAIVLTWACVILPVALFVPSLWLLRHRAVVIGASVGLSVLTVGYMVHVWTHFYHDGVGLMNFEIYAGFAAAFSGVTSCGYLRFLSRETKI
jgi:hypothetical protein